MTDRLVIVDGLGAPPHRWRAGLEAFARVEVVASLADAGALGAGDVVIVDVPDLDEPILEAVRGSPATHLLAAHHHELPFVIRAGASALFRYVVPRDGAAENVRALLERMASGDTEDASEDLPADWTSIVALVERAVATAVKVPGVIVRSYQPERNKLEIQLVFRGSAAFDRFHRDLPRRWGWPVRSRAGAGTNDADLDHPSLARFGEVKRDQEVYLRPVFRGGSRTGDCAYLALLPWTKDDRITVALGCFLEDPETSPAKSVAPRAIAEIHARAVRSVEHFTLPTLNDMRRGVRYLLEYNWVITKGYAGPDRRAEETSMVNRYMVGGRRTAIATELGERTGGFVDRVPPWIGRYFAAYALLATLDTFFTSRFVSLGTVAELNPVLAPLVVDHPWLFLVAKNLLAVTAFAIIVRFHLFRHAKHVLRASVGLYALLDVYWAVLLVGPFAR